MATSNSEQLLPLTIDSKYIGNSLSHQNSHNDTEQHQTGDSTSLEVSSLSMDSEEVCVDDPQVSPTSPSRTKEELCSPILTEDSNSTSTLCSSSPSKRKKSGFQSGVTIGYTYDAFFISDGRARRKPASSIASVDNEKVDNIPEVKVVVAYNSQDKPTKIASTHRQRYTCSECGKDYATSSNLSRHKQTHRSLDSKMAKCCPHCDKVYVSMPALSMHILTHDLKHKCHVCGKCFSRPWLLHGHLRAHTGEKPYGCAHCGRAFADRSNLRAHMQTHSTMKHFECGQCGKTFALKSYLNKHIESSCSSGKSLSRTESCDQLCDSQ